MNKNNPEEERPRKRRLWRLRLDWLKAEWSPTAGFTVTGVGIGAIVILVVSLTASHHTRAEPPPGETSGPTTTAPTTSGTTTTAARSTTRTTQQSPSRISNSTSHSTSTTTQTTSRTSDPAEPLVQLNEQWVELDPAQADCTKGVRFNFFQKITVTQAGTLTYRWERDDNAVQTKASEVTFFGAGNQSADHVLDPRWATRRSDHWRAVDPHHQTCPAQRRGSQVRV